MSSSFELDTRERNVSRAEDELREHKIAADRELSKVRAEIEVLKPRVDELRAQFNELSAQIVTVKSQVVDSVEYLRGVQASIANTHDVLKALEQSGETLAAMQAKKRAEIDQSIADYEIAAKAEADKRLVDVERQVKEAIAVLAQAREAKSKVDADLKYARATLKVTSNKTKK